LPENVIVNYGEKFTDLIMIQEGVVGLSIKLDAEDPESDQQFFILPTFSYFGDYQILFDLRSQVIYKNASHKVLISLCLSKDILFTLMENYPEARKFYMQRAWLRRIEFRRRQKTFLKTLLDLDKNQENIKRPIDNISSDTEDSSLLSEESI
jgi:signal-transduction protein with cAMP-binding, CBS, and nucleotidyltransferase domain